MATASPLISPSSDKQFWSTLRNRVETLLENRNSSNPTSNSSINYAESSKAKRLKEDTMLLFRGFDSIAYSISQLNNTLHDALQGARELAKAPTLTDIVQSTTNETLDKDEAKQDDDSEYTGRVKAAKKRKIDDICSGNQEQKEVSPFKDKEQKTHLQKVKKLAVFIASKSASLARELKSVKSDLCFMQERCDLLEEENRRLRDGIGKDNRPDEDDLVRLQLEALLAEKSRLATENGNLTRENECLRQLVEYHQFATEDLSASYEQAIQGLTLDFSSPLDEDPNTPRVVDAFEFRKPFDECFFEEDQVLPKDCEHTCQT